MPTIPSTRILAIDSPPILVIAALSLLLVQAANAQYTSGAAAPSEHGSGISAATPNPARTSTRQSTERKRAADGTNPQTLSFLPYAIYATGGYNPYSVAIADVNGDGKPDLVVANEGTDNGEGSVGVMLGNGDGTFQPPVDYDSGGGFAYSVAVADLNGDGKLDIVVGNGCASGTYCSAEAAVGVLLGNGDGTFQPPRAYSSGGGSLYGSSVAIADLRGNGKLDIVVTNLDAGNIGVLLSNGDGTFGTAVTYGAGGGGVITSGGATHVAIGDVNRDGKLDVVVTSLCPAPGCGSSYPYPDGVVGVLLGNGDGTFQPVVTYDPGGAVTYGVALADINGDGNTDIVTANCGPETCGGDRPGGTVGVLLGNGNGTFQAAVPYSAGNAPFSVAIADLNGDGIPDVVVGNEGTAFNVIGNYVLTVLLGNGDGTFQPSTAFLTGDGWSSSVAIADLNGDGKPDVAVTGYGVEGGNPPPGIVSVLLNSTGSTGAPTTTALTASPSSSAYGQPVTLTATVTAGSGTPAGSVVFSNGTTSLGSASLSSGKASISASALPAGSDSVTATYQGSSTFAPSTSSPVIQTVTKASTSTTLTSSATTAPTGQSVTFTAAVSSQYGVAASGTVTFYSESQSLGTATLSGSVAVLATLFSAAGTYSITAQYNGDSNNTGSNSAPLSETVLASTNTALTSAPSPAFVGQTITFTSTVSSSSGTPPNGELVAFYNGSSILGTSSLSSGVAMFSTASLGVGIYSITAAYAGDSRFASSTSLVLKQYVNSTTKSATTTTLTSSLDPSIYGQRVTFTATVTGAGNVIPTSTVAFTWGGGLYSIGSATLNSSGVAVLTKSNLNAGTLPLTAVYKGDANNLGSISTVLNQAVEPTTSASTLTASPNPSSVGQAVTFTAEITSPTVTPKGPVTFAVGPTVLGTVELSGGKATLTTSSLPTGSKHVTVTYTGSSDIAKSSASVTQVVQP